MAHRALLRHVDVLPSQVHRVLGELSSPSAGADAYDSELRTAFADAHREPAPDVTLLGLGEDAHIASIFPGSPLLEAPSTERLAEAVRAIHLNAWRITTTPRLLMASRSIAVLTGGSAKAAAVQAAIEGAPDITRVPAQLLRSAGARVSWMVDSAAAALVSPAARRG
jgi:6-phosphogluconolactonase